ncbi:uncharacterized protein A1O9_03679 [Exophiala aquamarina CBS 119918]|uniref:Uncharacterized protein n=1 Tax=Exophiala aquamarina CBS 119918 TaxID=1182545 RepID=A0A072PG74_9EURO|nr:uncharacterized protein A1O9_03679 [Exophiala aquamarina CBS 119918]KEF58836.1 hypothetical protein A1O9_03679 [Exophiala aquamarina CBS 119918]
MKAGSTAAGIIRGWLPSLRLITRLSSIYGTGVSEQPKAAVQRSRWIILTRCAIHILPIAVSTVLISLNLCNTYLGRTLPGAIIDPAINLALLQIAAKIHELLIVASVATVVLHYIRRQLVYGQGLPLGLLMGGFMFSGLGYFWSPELTGSLFARYALSSKIKILVILIFAGLFATLSGPASAVLLIPEEQPWNAGCSVYYLPATTGDLWPTVINSSNNMQQKLCSEIQLEHGLCAAGGYSSLWRSKDLIDMFRRPAYIPSSRRNLTTDLIFGPRGVDITNNFEMIRGLRYSGSLRGYACETAMVGTRIVDAMYHKQLLQDWSREVMSIGLNSRSNSPAESNYKYYRSLTATTSSRIPAVRVSCTPAQNMSSQSGQIELPILNEEGCSPSASRTTSVPRDWLNDSLLHQFRAFWNDKTADLGSTSGTIVVELPTDRDSELIAVVGCSVEARWADGSTITSDLRSYATSSNLNLHFHAPVSLGPIFKGPSTGLGQQSYSEFRPVLSNPTSTRISLSHDWLFDAATSNSSAPTDAGGWTADKFGNFLGNSSLFEDVLRSSGPSSIEIWNEDTPGLTNRTVALEWTLALIVTDALSRTGSELILDTTGPVSSWSIKEYDRVPDFQAELFRGGRALKRPENSNPMTEGKLEITIGGYSYQATSLTSYLAIALLALHMLVALSHIIFLFSSGESSSAWESFSELLVLAQNSRPAPIALRHTNAGIKWMRTYSRMARVYSVTPWDTMGESGQRSNVELMFDQDEEDDVGDANSKNTIQMPRVQWRKENTLVVLGNVKPNTMYGHPDDNNVRKRTSSTWATV